MQFLKAAFVAASLLAAPMAAEAQAAKQIPLRDLQRADGSATRFRRTASTCHGGALRTPLFKRVREANRRR